MTDSTVERLRLLEKILDTLPFPVTYVDSEGTVLYFNPKAGERPSRVPRTLGKNWRDCHSEQSIKSLDRICGDFRKGRREPHNFISRLTGIKELGHIIPVFEGDAFVGCIGVGHPLEYGGPEKTWQ